MGFTRFSTREMPDAQRGPGYGELLNSVLNLELTSVDAAPFEVETAMRLMPGGVVVAMSDLSPLRMNRTARHAADGNDNFVLSIPVRGAAFYKVGSGEAECGPGSAYFFPGDEPSHIANMAMARMSLSIPRTMLESVLRKPDAIALRQLGASPALGLLAGYARALTDDSLVLPLEIEALAASHICDLVASALSSGSEAIAADTRPGVRAARLGVIREQILRNLHRHDLTLERVARASGISPRYVQALFRDEGTTFRDFVLRERLSRAHAQLRDRELASTISEIAYSCGFGDLSYFNQSFRRRYAMTPGDVRRAARS